MCNPTLPSHPQPYIKWISLQTKQKQPTTKQSQTPLAFHNCLALRHRLLCIRDGNTTPRWRWGLRIAVQSHYASFEPSSTRAYQSYWIVTNGLHRAEWVSRSEQTVVLQNSRLLAFRDKLKLKKGDIFRSLRLAVMCQEHYHCSINLIKPRRRVQMLAAYSVKLTSL